MTEFAPPLRLHLDGEALIANWRYLQGQGDAGCGAAVKANSYGLGAREVVTRLRDAGCRDFFVAHWGEAAAIADLIPPEWISVLNGIDAGDTGAARELGAIPVLNTPKQVEMWRAAGGGRCHVMLDSGINRLGIGPEQMSADLLGGLDVDIAMSHLASADEDSPQNARQLALFCELVGQVDAERHSLANSAGIMLGRDYHFDLTRPGLAIYGGAAVPEYRGKIRQVVYPEARVLQVRTIGTGEQIGYNATAIATHDMRIATLAIGYADGYYRGFSNKGVAFFAGAKLPVIGRASMDLVIVDASNCSDIAEGDFAQLDFELSAAAEVSGMSQYELITGIGQRSERIWF